MNHACPRLSDPHSVQLHCCPSPDAPPGLQVLQGLDDLLQRQRLQMRTEESQQLHQFRGRLVEIEAQLASYRQAAAAHQDDWLGKTVCLLGPVSVVHQLPAEHDVQPSPHYSTCILFARSSPHRCTVHNHARCMPARERERFNPGLMNHNVHQANTYFDHSAAGSFAQGVDSDPGDCCKAGCHVQTGRRRGRSTQSAVQSSGG